MIKPVAEVKRGERLAPYQSLEEKCPYCGGTQNAVYTPPGGTLPRNRVCTTPLKADRPQGNVKAEKAGNPCDMLYEVVRRVGS